LKAVDGGSKTCDSNGPEAPPLRLPSYGGVDGEKIFFSFDAIPTLVFPELSLMERRWLLYRRNRKKLHRLSGEPAIPSRNKKVKKAVEVAISISPRGSVR